MTDQKQMNDKLLEFAGFEWVSKPQHIMRRGWIEGFWRIKGKKFRGNRYYYPPDFFNEDTGMRDIFKWVIPELRAKYIGDDKKYWLLEIKVVMVYDGEVRVSLTLETHVGDSHKLAESGWCKSLTVALATACALAVE